MRKVLQGKILTLLFILGANAVFDIFTFLTDITCVTKCVSSEAVTRSFSDKKLFLKFLKIHRKTPLPESLFFLRNFIKKEILAQVFLRNCEFFETFENTLFIEYLWCLFLLALFCYLTLCLKYGERVKPHYSPTCNFSGK